MPCNVEHLSEIARIAKKIIRHAARPGMLKITRKLVTQRARPGKLVLARVGTGRGRNLVSRMNKRLMRAPHCSKRFLLLVAANRSACCYITAAKQSIAQMSKQLGSHSLSENMVDMGNEERVYAPRSLFI